MLTTLSFVYGTPCSCRVATNWNQTAEAGATATRLPSRSAQLSTLRPWRTTGYLACDPTPISATRLVMPWLTAIGTSAGPTVARSSDPAASAIRASA